MKADTMSVLTLPQGGLTDMPSQVVSDKLLVCDLKSPVLAASLSAIKLPATNPIRTKHLIHTVSPETLLSSGTDNNDMSTVTLLNHVKDGAAEHTLESKLEPVMLVSADSADTKDQSLYSNVPVQASDETDVNTSDVMCETETSFLGNGVATVLPTASSVAPPVLKSAASVVAVSNEHLSPVDAIERSQTVNNKRVHGPMVGRKLSQTIISNSANGVGSLVHTAAPSNLAVPLQTMPLTSTSEAKTKSDKKLKRSVNASGQCGELELHNNGVVTRQGQLSHLAASPNNVTVIREVYENGSAMEYFAMQLDFALDSGVNTIIIEPSRLGRETTHWLRIGCFLRRMAMVSGSASIIAGAFGQDTVCLPLGTLASIASTIYIASWRPDPCALYRVERNVQQLQRLPLPEVSCTQPVVLVRCNRMRLKNGLHDSVSVAALAVCLWRLYRWYHN